LATRRRRFGGHPDEAGRSRAKVVIEGAGNGAPLSAFAKLDSFELIFDEMAFDDVYTLVNDHSKVIV